MKAPPLSYREEQAETWARWRAEAAHTARTSAAIGRSNYARKTSNGSRGVLGREVRRARDGGAPQGFCDEHAFKAWTLFREIRKRWREVA